MLLFSEADVESSASIRTTGLNSETIRFKGIDFYEELHVIIDGHGHAYKPSYQLNDTLGGDILLMTFGESVAPVSIRGFVFDAVCGATSTSTNNDLNGQKGVAALIRGGNETI